MSVRRLLQKLLLALVIAGAVQVALPPDLSPIQTAEASYTLDGTNDSLSGSTTTTFASGPLTIAIFVKVTAHPEVVDHFVNFGNSNSSFNDALALRTTGTDNQWQATSNDSGNTSSNATVTVDIDNTWACWVGVFTNDSLRDVYVGGVGNTAQNTTSRAVGDAIQHIRIGETLAGANDAVGKVAEFAIWDIALNGTQIGNYCSGTAASTIASSDLIVYVPMSTASLSNDGVDATGDLTANGNAAFDADHPTITGGASAPEFSSGPTLDDCDSDSCTYDFTPSAESDLHWAVYVPAASAPADCPAVEAGSGSLAHGTETDQSGASSVEIPLIIAKGSFYFCLENGDGESDVESDLVRQRDARAGFALVTMASHTDTGICGQDADFDPDCADDDVFEHEVVTNQSADCQVNIGTDGDVELTPQAPGACDGQQTFEYSAQDRSNTTTGCFTAPSGACFVSDDTAYINNNVPVCEAAVSIVVLTEDAPMTPRDLVVFGSCDDADADALSFAVTGGTLPNGTSLSGTGNKDWTGTPDTEDETGEEITIEACDPAAECDDFSFGVFVLNTVTMIDLAGLTASEAAEATCAAFPWRCDDVGISIGAMQCSEEEPGTVIAQDPAAEAEIEAFDEISVTLARACAPPGEGGKVKRLRARKTPSGMTIH